jgi:hypothetical protein
MHTLLTLTVLRPHGNLGSELTKQESGIRNLNSTADSLYPFNPLFFPITILPVQPSSKKEIASVLDPIKEKLQNTRVEPFIEHLFIKDNWLYAGLVHPCFTQEGAGVSIAKFPSFKTQLGIPLAFSKETMPPSLNIEQAGIKKLRVFTLSILSFSWNEENEYSFSWGEIGSTWVKIEK